MARQNTILLKRALHCLKQDKLIAFNTDTIPGVAALAPRGLSQLYSLKARSPEKKLVWMTYNLEALEEWVTLSPQGRTLASRHWPGPLTLVFELRQEKIAKIAANLPANWPKQTTLAFRIPGSAFVLELLRQIKAPLAVTSLNLSGTPPLRSLSAAKQVFGKKIAFYCGNLEESSSLNSTVVDVRLQDLKILRSGGLTAADLMA